MGKYIHLFQSKEEFNQAIDNNFTEPWVSYTKENDKVDYYKSEYEHKCEQYFTFEATRDGTMVYFRQSSYAVDDGLAPLKVEVSIDNGESWTEFTAAPAEDNEPGEFLAELNKGETILIRGRNEAYGYHSNNEGENIENCNFYADKPCYVYGNIMSLIGGDDFVKLREVKEYAFALFFCDYADELDMSWVLSKEGEALLLPATTLSDYCYCGMFQNCTGLTIAPELPATTLAPFCYNSMFYRCSSLTTAPKLPATTLAERCYGYMFSICANLTIAPELPATILAAGCYAGMFSHCDNLINAPELPATTLADDCYSLMFYHCFGLTVAPELPATTLAISCYSSMFHGCVSLVNAPVLPATTLKQGCYTNMFCDCASLVDAPELPATTMVNNCYSYMFSGCTGLATAPELPAITLETSCYSYMFNGCSNLSYIKAMFTTTPGNSYTNSWVSGVKATGTFVKYSAANWNVTGDNGIPTGWTVETASVQ